MPVLRRSAREAKKRVSSSAAAPRTKKKAPQTRNVKIARKETAILVSAPSSAVEHVFVWGAGDSGQLGLGDFADQIYTPRRNTNLSDIQVETIAAGGMHTLLIDSRGTVRSCGANDNHALGRPTPDEELDPDFLLVEALEGFRAIKIAAGDSVSVAISDAGELRVWGTFRNAEGASMFSPGLSHQPLPVSLCEFQEKIQIVDAVAGDNHCVLLSAAGNVYTIGVGSNGQLGRRLPGRGQSPTKPTLLEFERSKKAKAVAVGTGEYHSFAVDERGQVWGWGVNKYGQLGTGKANESVLIPTRVQLSLDSDGDRIVQVAAGNSHSIFLSKSGKVFASGLADEGRLGIGHFDKTDERLDPAASGSIYASSPTAVAFPAFDEPTDRVVHISCGSNNSLAVTRDGAMYSWGRQVVGELGLGKMMTIVDPNNVEVVKKERHFVDEPTRVTIKEDCDSGAWKATMAVCGGQHCVALVTTI